jgi:hypothetical protein
MLLGCRSKNVEFIRQIWKWRFSCISAGICPLERVLENLACFIGILNIPP